MFDILIKNGRIIDGTGSPSYLSDVAIKDGKIVKVARGIKGDAQKVIDARGLTITPGFIDSHSHSDGAIIKAPGQREKVEQGITTAITCQCGNSPAPISRDAVRDEYDVIEGVGSLYDIQKDFPTYVDAVKNIPQGANQALLIGHNSIRRAAMGNDFRAPTAPEMEAMKNHIRKAMENGALGISFGLGYNPGGCASFDELVELCSVVAEYDGLAASHIRDEGDRVVASVAEFINMLKKSGIKTGIISHHKASNRNENWGKVHHTLKMIDDACKDGLDIYCDVYPYSAFNTDLSAVFTPMEFRARKHEEHMAALYDTEEIEKLRAWIIDRYGSDDLSWVLTARVPGVPEFSGRYISDIAQELGTDHLGALVELWKRSDFSGYACFFATSEDDIETLLKHPRAMICTDSGSLINPNTVHHPRLRGSFPRVLGRYVREKGVTTLPEMIRKMTSLPARVYGFKAKGLVWEGMDADLCVFDAENIIDRAEYTSCFERAEGLNYVIVGGKIAAEDAVYNGERNAKVLLR